jgi:hypothetical protein
MGYFPNMDSWEFWAATNCFRCDHWPKDDDAPCCPVETAHQLYSYELCNATDQPGKVILDLLIPIAKSGVGNEKCAMFKSRDGITDKHLKDWDKYKAAMAEMSAAAQEKSA